MTRSRRLRMLQWLTVLVPAVCAGLYETVRHSLLATSLPEVLGTALAVALVLAISLAFARVSFGIIRQTETRLVERNRQLEALSRQVERLAVTDERDRLAREMHDGIAQVMAYLLVRLDTISGLLERGRADDAAREVQRLRESGEGAYADVREAIAGLRVRAEAGPIGLARALAEYTTQFAGRTDIDVRFEAHDIDGAPQDLSPAAELHLIRIAQEALANVRKHARASRVEVRFWRETGRWHVSVRDDGAGFDPDAMASRTSMHFGLAMMRERAEKMGGSLSIGRHPDGGIIVHAQVPGVPDAGLPSMLPAPLLPLGPALAEGEVESGATGSAGGSAAVGASPMPSTAPISASMSAKAHGTTAPASG